MKQFNNISNLSSRDHGTQPMGQGYARVILLDSELMGKRCLYKWVG
ncbi:hypothetical protein [uncultured Chryseobacterium sp.]|nr:hypothetical protein [uncultured Chryseobacterium sp.]